jgi:hypothetical protein
MELALIRCIECLEEKKEEDFYLVNTCYRCQYKKKSKEKKAMPKKICKHCGGILRGFRWIYCSEECADEGKRTANKNYWVKNVDVDKVYW